MFSAFVVRGEIIIWFPTGGGPGGTRHPVGVITMVVTGLSTINSGVKKVGFGAMLEVAAELRFCSS